MGNEMCQRSEWAMSKLYDCVHNGWTWSTQSFNRDSGQKSYVPNCDVYKLKRARGRSLESQPQPSMGVETHSSEGLIDEANETDSLPVGSSISTSIR